MILDKYSKFLPHGKGDSFGQFSFLTQVVPFVEDLYRPSGQPHPSTQALLHISGSISPHMSSQDEWHSLYTRSPSQMPNRAEMKTLNYQ